MYPYLLVHQDQRLSRFVLSQPARISWYRSFDFGGNTGVLCAGTSASKPTVDFCWNAAKATVVSFFEARVL